MIYNDTGRRYISPGVLSNLFRLHRQSGSPSPSATSSLRRLKTALASQSKCIEAVNAHHLDITRISCEIETDHDHQVGQHQDASFEVIALALAVYVAEQEDAEDDRHHVPLRENEDERVIEKLFRIDVARGDSAEKDKGGDLEQADLESICRTNFH